MPKSLAEQLAKFANPEPEDFDPEDIEQNGRSDVDSDDERRSHYVDVEKSRLRDDEVEVDSKKYSGSRVSRRDLASDGSKDGSDGSEDDSGEEDVSEDVSEDDSEEVSAEEEQSEGSVDASASENESENDSESENEGEEKFTNGDQVAEILKAEQKQLVSRLSASSETDVAKGKAVQAQLAIYEGLLDARISLQKILQLSNGLQAGQTEEEEEQGEVDQADAKAKLYDLLGQVETLRYRLAGSEPAKSKKRSLQEYADEADELDTKLAAQRENVLAKWSRKVQLSSGANALQSAKFKSLNQSAAVQVTSVLADMDRLHGRTKVNRSQYTVHGEVPDESELVFDDSDFYRLLLKDLVDRRMADSGAANGLKWTAAKTKTKKNVDTKASKGRKLRYTVQEKVQGFDAPRPVFSWTDEQAEELFATLLGQKITMDDAEPEEELEVGDFALFGSA